MPSPLHAAVLLQHAAPGATGRLLLCPDDMHACRINTGELVVIGLASQASTDSDSASIRSSSSNRLSPAITSPPTHLWQACASTYHAHLASSTPPSLLIGGQHFILGIAWPMAKLPKGGCGVSAGLYDALGRPQLETSTLLFYRLAHTVHPPSPCIDTSPPVTWHAPASHLVLRLAPTNAALFSPAILPVSLPTTASSTGAGLDASGPMDPARRLLLGLSPVASASPTSRRKQHVAAVTPTLVASQALSSSWAAEALRSSSSSSSSSFHDDASKSALSTLILRHLQDRLLLVGNVLVVPLLGQDTVLVVEAVFSKSVENKEAAVTLEGVVAGHVEPVRVDSMLTTIDLLPPEAHFSIPDALQARASSSSSTFTSSSSLSREALLARVMDAAKEQGQLSDASQAAVQAAQRAFLSGWAALHASSTLLESLGGMDEALAQLDTLVLRPLTSPHLFSSHGIAPPTGVLLYGLPGTGKTALIRAVAAKARASLLVLNGADVLSSFAGESESCLRGIFAAARAIAPSIVLLDELDALAPARGDKGGEGGGETSARIVSTLLAEMDALSSSSSSSTTTTSPVIILGATNRPEALDPSLRRPGRFDREIEMTAPSPSQRLDILTRRLQFVRHELTKQEVEDLAASTHGHVPADLVALVNEACLHALRRHVAALQPDKQHLGQIHSSANVLVTPPTTRSPPPLVVTKEDVLAAQTLVRPSALREHTLQVPRVSWDDIGGLANVKQRLREAIEWPLTQPERLAKLGAKPPRGVLLYGPPGCSKTLLARAVASAAKMNFLSVKGPELYSKWVGESEKAVASLFKRARQAAPCVVFLDEIDGLATSRGSDLSIAAESRGGGDVSQRVLTQLLVEMDGLQGKKEGNGAVVVLAATNRPDALDPALLRPGRFDRLLFIPPPDEPARHAILLVHTRRTPIAPDVDLVAIASRTSGFTGADLAALCREAAVAALTESLDAERVAMRHFEQALQLVRPSLPPASGDWEMYRRFQRAGGGDGGGAGQEEEQVVAFGLTDDSTPMPMGARTPHSEL